MTSWEEIRDELLEGDPEARRIYDVQTPRMGVIRRVINARAERGWSQRRLAEAAGMTQPQVARFESGDSDPRLSTVQRLYAALDIDAPPLHDADTLTTSPDAADPSEAAESLQVAREMASIHPLWGDSVTQDLSEDELNELVRLERAATPGPWVAFIENEAAIGGSNMISVGLPGTHPPDMYVYLDGEPAPDADFKFIAAIRTKLPLILAELHRRRT